MDWKNITTKATMIDEIKRSVKKKKKEKILRSVLALISFDRKRKF